MVKKNPHSPLRLERIIRQLTIEDLSELTGISRGTIGHIETGKCIPRREHARKLYIFFEGKVPLETIYDPYFKYEADLPAKKNKD